MSLNDPLERSAHKVAATPGRQDALGAAAPTFEIYIDDDRYSVPSLYLITAPSDEQAQELCGEIWRESDHHLGVELRRDGERVFALGTLALHGPGAPDCEPSPAP
jgi:hypothetical protein